MGCQGLQNGKMDWVQPTSTAPRAGNVYLIRGLIGVFSTGMDELCGKLEKQGISAHVFQDGQQYVLEDEIIRKYKGVQDPEPLVLIGHSYGADDVMRISQKLKDAGVKVDLAVTIDSTTPPPVPPNVALTYNYYQSTLTDGIPMFRGIPLKEEQPGSVKVYNMDLRKDRTDLLVPGTNHINIDKNPLLHDVIVKQVLETCIPRETWVARHGGAVRPAANVQATPAQPAKLTNSNTTNKPSPQVARTPVAGQGN
jgi:hypothetical protein